MSSICSVSSFLSCRLGLPGARRSCHQLRGRESGFQPTLLELILKGLVVVSKLIDDVSETEAGQGRERLLGQVA